MNQSGVVEQINDIIDFISNFKTVNSVQTTTETKEPKLLETQEEIFGLSDPVESDIETEEQSAEDLDFLVKLLLNQEKKFTAPSSAKSQTTKKVKSKSDEQIDKQLENLLKGILDEGSKELKSEGSKEGSVENSEESYEDSSEEIYDSDSDYIDSVVENLVDDILREESQKEKNEFSAVEEALTRLLGKDPKKQNKISSDILETVIELDEFLREEEEERQARVDTIRSLADRAIDLVTGSVDIVKTKGIESSRNPENDLHLDSIANQLKRLLLS